MCGVGGAVARDRSSDVTGTLERLSASLAHRGPDAAGTHLFHGRSAGLVHRRLSIVDVACGAQPMPNEDRTVWVSYNGEIYNHRELRQELVSAGHVFRTHADTEVLVHGWEEWGPALLERLNGIYALALLDERPGHPLAGVWLARDPVGVKPMYAGRARGLTWFSSELAAARSAGLVDERLRPEAFDEFLVYRFVPSPGTFYRDVWKLPPGTCCRIDPDAEGMPVFRPFHPQFAPAAVPRSSGEWEEALRSELRASVERQLMADVPVGVLLSGGVDSTVIARLMRDALGEAPAAFAVGFAEEPEGGELAPARKAARALGIPLNEVLVHEAAYLERWPEHAGRLGEPIANSGVLLVGMLCAEVRKTHKVVLTGQGADEPLGGYPRHAAERHYPLARHLRPLLRLVPERVAGSDQVRRMQRIAGEEDEARRFTEILAVFAPREALALTGHAMDPGALAEPVRRVLPADGSDDGLNRLLAADARLSLADDLLIVADHMSMAESVELRVPFLDLRLLALVSSMPSRYKLSVLGARKWLYRRAVRQLLPPDVRRLQTGMTARFGRKLGFATPMNRWFTEWAGRSAGEYLLGPSARLPDFLASGEIRRLLEAVRAGAPRSRQLLTLYVLESWLRGALPGRA
ncbi:MAG: asparagine synthase (glutamine-hydrolyzing) [Gemmatimonadota bacterium]